ncbi:type II toxin-antitoxin system VapC family toxin [Rhizobium sp. SAFR-030]|uniref:type II toxin-antitoxin system VapC family toxin n=1 Tax=Rhizobium sp. SAFR-030 TaxID=3387277 RepID=UPI003F7D8D82
MFLDASALVAILTGEATANQLLQKLAGSAGPFHYTSLTMYEAVIAIARKTSISQHGDQVPTPAPLILTVQADVEQFLDVIGATEVPIPLGAHHAVLAAARTYGRAVGHPAKLNFGDCFAYASARSLDVPLLFVGNDFALTDIKPA